MYTDMVRSPPQRLGRVLVMQPTEGPMVPTAEDRGEGDIVLKVRVVEAAGAARAADVVR